MNELMNDLNIEKKNEIIIVNGIANIINNTNLKI